MTPTWRLTGVGDRDLSRALDGRPQPDRLERAGLQPERPVLGAVLVGQPDVGLVEEQQVLAFDVEDQRLCVRRLVAEHVAVEQPVEQETRVARLGRDAGDAGDVHVRAAASVEKREVDVHRKPVARDPGGEPLLHLIEVQRFIARASGCAGDCVARSRWHVQLGLEACADDVRGPCELDGQQPLIGEEHVAVKAAALVPRADHVDEPANPQRARAGDIGLHSDDVVELQERVLLNPDPELKWC